MPRGEESRNRDVRIAGAKTWQKSRRSREQEVHQKLSQLILRNQANTATPGHSRGPDNGAVVKIVAVLFPGRMRLQSDRGHAVPGSREPG